MYDDPPRCVRGAETFGTDDKSRTLMHDRDMRGAIYRVPERKAVGTPLPSGHRVDSLPDTGVVQHRSFV
ncbi:hypothetical protein [Gordonia mangrovi]|uniref:hypothetical protein n=1 Tax=Gordonia mangrovi TaxID=2665643 RepID=UPI0021ABE5A6|nr:hypothetical protein [Gordonia mangrovi]UVF80025.1 hypothetical protein NWF22_09465 [Gordonia mangrovi]